MSVKTKGMTLGPVERNIIVRGEWLTDTHMNHFQQLLASCSDYKPVETWRIQLLDTIQAVFYDKDHSAVNKLYSTAVVHAYDSEGSPRACRVLLDCGSQANFVSKKFVKALGLQTRPLSVSVRQRFWPLSLRSTTRGIIQKCIGCFKAKPAQSEVLMSSLPATRVNVSRPFSHCGVDYAGPFLLREGKRRNARSHKSYVSFFVCFATKAVYLELVEAFIAAFKRFISRRGKPSHMYSDNGTTFVGAQKQIQELYDIYNSHEVQAKFKNFFLELEISWNFIPPNAPHFGGLWEAAVKSAKHHMTRIVGKALLTFKEMQTVFCEIEAILNSRPLTPLSSDPNDLAYLSPGHFLVGTVLNGLPYADFTDVNENRLMRLQRVEQTRQHFWRRWSNEYLHPLQARSKWMVDKGTPLSAGQLVLIQQQNLAPLQWAMGRVQEVHPGSDGLVRTALVKTAKGSYVRPLSKLAILPIEC
ncbi:hypothetical protein ALC62_13647 [Cyphomyrmex costatus]|uniref:Integrase catalytic domain-containing protein n=1 Tax=Cyphomyrmex costatus TaxID=456900 RepID=A0A151I9J7_9HYME|nr:hypothetical protein ALC62_13647 [Cyphomyrmex costatus]